MNAILWVGGAFVSALFFSEIALRGTKLQTGLNRVLAVHVTVVISLLIYFAFTARFDLWAATLIFWAGAFLTWFGVRSHMESSILLRMLYLVRGRIVPEGSLLQEYESHYGQSQRLDELFRGNLLQQTPAGVVVSPKGKFILRIVSFLR